MNNEFYNDLLDLLEEYYGSAEGVVVYVDTDDTGVVQFVRQADYDSKVMFDRIDEAFEMYGDADERYNF